MLYNQIPILFQIANIKIIILFYFILIKIFSSASSKLRPLVYQYTGICSQMMWTTYTLVYEDNTRDNTYSVFYILCPTKRMTRIHKISVFGLFFYTVFKFKVFFFNSPHVLNVDQFILLKYGCSGLETYPKPIHNPVPFLKCCTYLKKNNCSSKMQKIHILPSENLQKNYSFTADNAVIYLPTSDNIKWPISHIPNLCQNGCKFR